MYNNNNNNNNTIVSSITYTLTKTQNYHLFNTV